MVHTTLLEISCCGSYLFASRDMRYLGKLIIEIFASFQGIWLVGWLVGFVALRPKSTAMVIAGRSVHLTTLFPGQA